MFWVFFCARNCHNVWESPLSLFLKDRFLFTSQLQAGSAHRFIWGQDVCVHVFIFFFLKVQCCGGQQLILNLGYLTW